MGVCGVISYFMVILSIGLGLILFHGPAMPPLCAIFRMTCRPTAFGGHVEPGLEPIAEVLKRHLQDGADIGASVAMYLKGKKVVDIYGGWRDVEAREPYTNNLLQRVWSCSKVLESIAIAMLVDRGIISYEDRVSKFWPEFAQHGKDAVTIGDLMAHRAVLWVPKEEAPSQEVFRNPDAYAAYLADRRVLWPANSTGYHCLIRGGYIGELIRRVDPKRRSTQQFIEDEISGPLGVEFYLGGPRGAMSFTRDTSRLARNFPAPQMQMLLRLLPRLFVPDWLAVMLGADERWPTELVKVFVNESSLGHLACSSAVPKEMQLAPDKIDVDTDSFDVEIPSANGYSNAASLARIAAAMANRGSLDDVTLLSRAGWEKATKPIPTVRDLVLGQPVNYTLGGFGYDLPFTGPGWTGWMGFGGATMFFNTAKQASFSYVPNAMYGVLGDYRSKDFFDVVNKILSKL